MVSGESLAPLGDGSLFIWFGHWVLPPRIPPRWPKTSWPLSMDLIHWLLIIPFNPLHSPWSSTENRLREGKNLSLGHASLHGRARILLLTRTLVDLRSQAKVDGARIGKRLCNKTCYTDKNEFYYLLINFAIKGPFWSSENFMSSNSFLNTFTCYFAPYPLNITSCKSNFFFTHFMDRETGSQKVRCLKLHDESVCEAWYVVGSDSCG